MTIGAYEVLSDWSEYNLKWTSNVSVSSTCASSFQTNANATSSNPLYAQFNITSLVKKWYIDESPNYGVAIKYMSGNASTLNIKTRENSGFHTSLIIGYNMDPIPISSGTYFLKNAELDKYVQIDDNDSNNNYSTEGAILELWTGNGANYQKWVFEYLHNGYYKVKSSHSNKVISVDYNYLNSDAHALVQETYNGSHRQQWSVLITPNGMYKIKPRSSENYSTDWVMCAGNGIIGNGRNVEQREYSNNADYKDEWIIINISNSYGCQTHRVLTQNQQSAINCHGYAMQRDDSPWYVDYGTGTIAWCHRTEEYVYSIQTLNATIKHNADVCIKLDFEEWLTESGYSWRYEPYFCSNGESVELNTNEYRVVLRYGINYVYGYIFHDYHFWYQTYDGTWSNKHGQYSEVNLGSGVNPFTTGTTGWALANYSDFYDGEIFSYIITIYE